MFNWHEWLEGVNEEDIVLAISYLRDGKSDEEVAEIFLGHNGGFYGSYQTSALIEEAQKKLQNNS